MDELPVVMDAAYVEGLGRPEQIRHGQRPVPLIGPTEVLVAVQMAAVNPVDTLVRSGEVPTETPFPFVLGRDLVGTVAGVGESAAGFSVGERVWSSSLGHGGRQGSFSQYAAVPVDRLYHVPDGVDSEQVVAVAHLATTAWLALFRHSRLGLGQTVYIGDGSGNVGEAAVRLAAAAGARVIASASGEGLDRCRFAGATVVIDHRDPEANEQIRATAPAGVDVYWDTSGRHDFDAAVELMSRGGRLLLTATGSNPRVELPISAAYMRDVSLHGFFINNATTTDLAAAAGVINQRLGEGTLSAQIAETMPLTYAAEAHRRVESGLDSSARLLVQM